MKTALIFLIISQIALAGAVVFGALLFHNIKQRLDSHLRRIEDLENGPR